MAAAPLELRVRTPDDGQTGDAAPSPVEEQSSDGGQTDDSMSTSADARPACPKKHAGSRRKRRNRKKRKRNTGAGGSQGGSHSGEPMAAPAQSQTQSGSQSVPSDRGSQPRFSGREQGWPLVGLRPAKVCVVSKAHVAIEVLSPGPLEREQGRLPVGLCPVRIPPTVSGTSDGSRGATPCLQMTTVASVMTEVPPW